MPVAERYGVTGGASTVEVGIVCQTAGSALTTSDGVGASELAWPALMAIQKDAAHVRLPVTALAQQALRWRQC